MYILILLNKYFEKLNIHANFLLDLVFEFIKKKIDTAVLLSLKLPFIYFL